MLRIFEPGVPLRQSLGLRPTDVGLGLIGIGLGLSLKLPAESLTDLADCALVVEAVVERLDVKQRLFTELEAIAFGLDRDLPMLGICGGAQAINVALGGSLYQDIPTQCPAALKHQQEERSSNCGHVVEVVRGTLLYKICRCRKLNVNTTHHQAIRRIGEGIAINAMAPDGLIEGIESKNHSFVVGLQWHPEVLAQSEVIQRRIFSSFVLACRRLRRAL